MKSEPPVLSTSLVAVKPEMRDIRKMLRIRSFSTARLDELKIVHAAMQNRTALNAYREQRTKLLQKSKKQNCVIMVASPTSQSGASLVATNLAAVFALDKTKTSLLVDCNLYSPSLSQLLPEPPEFGLTDHLVEPDVRIEEIIYATGIDRVRLIPIGAHVESAAEHFDSVRMQAFMKEVRGRYSDRYIFVDAPPLESAESRILSAIADIVVLVVPYGKVTNAQVSKAVEVVGKDKLAGLVFNN